MTGIDEALAKALRLNWHGEMRPLWEDMTTAARSDWLQQAQFLRGVLEREGFRIVAADSEAIMAPPS